MHKRHALSHLAVAVALAAATASGASRTSDVVLVPDGSFKSHDGRPGSIDGVQVDHWKLTAARAERIVAMYRQMGRDQVVDYEHASDDETLRAAGKAVASGWVKYDTVRYVPGEGIRATVEWTARAAAAIDAKEFRFVSRVFLFSKQTGEVIWITKVALTNDPALNLVASAALSADVTAMLTAELGDDDSFSTPPTPTKGVHMDKKLLCLALGLAAASAETMSDETLLTAISSLKAKADTPNPADFVAIAVLKAEQTAHSETKAKLAAIEGKESLRECDALIAKAKAEGVDLTEAYETHLKTVGEKLGVAQLSAMIADMPRNPAKSGRTQPEANGGGGRKDGGAGGVASLTQSQQSMARLMGVTDEAYAAQLTALRERGLEV